MLEPKKLTRRRVLLIGGAGYIGTVVIPHLLTNGYDVCCSDCLLYDNDVAVMPFAGHPNFTFSFGDFTERDHIQGLLADVTDVVVLGGLVGDPITKKYPEESDRINLHGIMSVLDALEGHNLNRVIFISTCSNYGQIRNNEIASETHPLKPMSLYAEAKVAAEEALRARAGAVDYQPVMLRFATAFGLSPRMRFDLTVSEFTREMYLGHELLVYDPDTWRPYCHVRDFADVIHRVLEAPEDTVSGQVFNAGGDINNCTKRGLVEEISRLLPDASVRYQEQGTDPRNYRVDFSKIRTNLHFEPSYAIRDGIEELISALRERLFDRVEERRNFHGNYVINYGGAA